MGPNFRLDFPEHPKRDPYALDDHNEDCPQFCDGEAECECERIAEEAYHDAQEAAYDMRKGA